MNLQNNVFGRNTGNAFATNNSNSFIKKGQLPGHNNAMSNIFGQGAASGQQGTGSSAQTPFAHIFNKTNTQNTNTIQNSSTNQNIFGQINAANKSASPFQANPSSNGIFQRNDQNQFSSPFNPQKSNPLQNQQGNGIFKLQGSQAGSSSGTSFANLFNQGSNQPQNRLSNAFNNQQNSTGGIFPNNPTFNSNTTSTGIFNQNNQTSQQTFPFQHYNQPFTSQQNQPFQSQQNQPFQSQNQPLQQQQSFQQQNVNQTLPFLQQGQNQQQNNIFGQSNLPQQQVSQACQQLQGNTQNALNTYLLQYQQQLSNRQPFSTEQAMAPQGQQTLPAQYKFNPQSQDRQYYLFLNNLIRDDTIRSHATHEELSDFASSWADSNLPSLPRSQQITKLFNAKDLRYPSPLQSKDLPPVEITEELLQSMNDPFQSRLILSELSTRCKAKAESLLFALVRQEQNLTNLNMKVKDLSCFREIAIVWIELKALNEKIGQMKERSLQLEKTKHSFRQKVGQRCQLFKQCFVQVNRNNSLIGEAKKEIEMLTEYLSRQLQPIFKALATNTPMSIEDPDTSILAIAGTLLHKVTNLDNSLAHYFSQSASSEEQLDLLAVTENLCHYYQSVAEQLYEVNEKMKKCINLVSRENYQDGEDVIRKIKAKANEIVTKKLDAYYKINEIENLLAERSQLSVTPQSASSTRSKGTKQMLTIGPFRKPTASSLMLN